MNAHRSDLGAAQSVAATVRPARLRRAPGVPLEDAVQSTPVEDQFASRGLALLFPFDQQIQAGVVDEGQLVQMHMHMRVCRQFLQGRGQLRQTYEGGGAFRDESR